jgi:hypothetical protein
VLLLNIPWQLFPLNQLGDISEVVGRSFPASFALPPLTFGGTLKHKFGLSPPAVIPLVALPVCRSVESRLSHFDHYLHYNVNSLTPT